MPILFGKEAVIQGSTPQDTGKLAEINTHELLRASAPADTQESQPTGQIASFDQVRSIGAWFFAQKYNAALPSSKELPAQLFNNSGEIFMGKLALGPTPQDHFPVTIQPVFGKNGMDLKVHIVPIHFGALEVAAFAQHTDSLLALAAAATVAPQFIFALEGGIITTQCATKKMV